MPKVSTTAENLKEYFSSGVNKAKWKEAKAKAAEAQGNNEYDDGKYSAQLIDAKVGRSEASGRLQTTLTFRFTSGEYKGKSVRQYQGVEDQGIEFLLKTLKIMGYEDVNPEDIEDSVFPELKKKKPVVKIRLKTKEGSEYQNLYVLGLEEKSNESDDSEATESGEDDEPVKRVSAEDDEEGEETVEVDSEADDDDEEAEPTPKKKAKPVEVEDDEESEDEVEQKPKSKPSKKVEVEEEEEEVEVVEDEEKVGLKIGMKLKVRVDGKEIKGKLLNIITENKNGTGEIRVESLKTGKKYVVAIPDDFVDLIED